MSILLEWAASIPELASLDTVYQSAILTLAIYGWRESSNCTTPVVQCDLCYQRMDFTLYTPLASTTQDKEQQNISNNNGQHQYESITETDWLSCDPALEHRWYCPWIRKEVNNVISTGTSTPLAGWEYIVQDIYTLTSRHHTTSTSTSPPSSTTTTQNTSTVVSSIVAALVES
jgi:hypothetical protein